jgi:hypothetical protein
LLIIVVGDIVEAVAAATAELLGGGRILDNALFSSASRRGGCAK